MLVPKWLFAACDLPGWDEGFTNAAHVLINIEDCFIISRRFCKKSTAETPTFELLYRDVFYDL